MNWLSILGFSATNRIQEILPMENVTFPRQSRVTRSPDSELDFERTVKLIKLEDPAGAERLYAMLNGGMRILICRSLGNDNADDLVHDTLLAVVKAIQNNTLRDPNALAGYVRGVVRNLILHELRDRSTRRREQPMDTDAMGAIRDRSRTPEDRAMDQENLVIMRQVLAGLSERDREILVRFYVREQPPGQIMSEMGLSPTQFRVAKSKAKARFASLGKRKLVPQGNQFDHLI